MKLFISWSGETTRAIAEELRNWFPSVLPFVQPFVSSEDIRKGTRWWLELSVSLQEMSCGILCLVPENANAPWINYEAGALSKSVSESRLFP